MSGGRKNVANDARRRGNKSGSGKRNASGSVRAGERGTGVATETETEIATATAIDFVSAVMTATEVLREIGPGSATGAETAIRRGIGTAVTAATTDPSLQPKSALRTSRKSSPRKTTNVSSEKRWPISFGKASASRQSNPSSKLTRHLFHPRRRRNPRQPLLRFSVQRRKSWSPSQSRSRSQLRSRSRSGPRSQLRSSSRLRPRSRTRPRSWTRPRSRTRPRSQQRPANQQGPSRWPKRRIPSGSRTQRTSRMERIQNPLLQLRNGTPTLRGDGLGVLRALLVLNAARIGAGPGTAIADGEMPAHHALRGLGMNGVAHAGGAGRGFGIGEMTGKMIVGTTAETITAKPVGMIPVPHAKMIGRTTGKTSAGIVVGLVPGPIGANEAVPAPGPPEQTTRGKEVAPVVVMRVSAVAHLALEPNGVIDLVPGCGSAAERGAALGPGIVTLVINGNVAVLVPEPTSEIAAATETQLKTRSARRTRPRNSPRRKRKRDDREAAPGRPPQPGHPRD